MVLNLRDLPSCPPPLSITEMPTILIYFQGGLVWESGRFLSNMYNSRGVASPKIRGGIEIYKNHTIFQGASLRIREAWHLCNKLYLPFFKSSLHLPPTPPPPPSPYLPLHRMSYLYSAFALGARSKTHPFLVSYYNMIYMYLQFFSAICTPPTELYLHGALVMGLNLRHTPLPDPLSTCYNLLHSFSHLQPHPSLQICTYMVHW